MRAFLRHSAVQGLELVLWVTSSALEALAPLPAPQDPVVRVPAERPARGERRAACSTIQRKGVSK